jgi:hypothetical protein
MLHRKAITIYCENDTKLINTLCGQNVDFFNVKVGGAYSNYWSLSD